MRWLIFGQIYYALNRIINLSSMGKCLSRSMTFAHSVAPFVLLPFDLEGRSVGRSEVQKIRTSKEQAMREKKEERGVEEISAGREEWVGILIKGILDISERPVFVLRAYIYLSYYY